MSTKQKITFSVDRHRSQTATEICLIFMIFFIYRGDPVLRVNCSLRYWYLSFHIFSILYACL